MLFAWECVLFAWECVLFAWECVLFACVRSKRLSVKTKKYKKCNNSWRH